MSGLIEITQYQAEALITCLGASILWAGALFIGARGLERSNASASGERLWTAALLFAVLPSLAAPMLAAFGISLRPAPEPVIVETIRSSGSFATVFAPGVEAAAKPEIVTAEQMIGAAAIIYVYGVALTLFLWAARQAGLRYAVACAEPVADRAFLDRIERWAERLEVRVPDIRRSRHVSSVCIIGVFRQTVLIPRGIDARVSSEDLVLMCAHELAHVRRGDTRLFTATQLARVLFWFNPLVDRIAAHAELAAEERADALVLANGVDRRAYAACFVEGLKFAAWKMVAPPALAPSFTPADRGGRRRRLNSILSPAPERRTPLATRLMLSAATSAVALAALGQAAFAVDPESAGDRRRALSMLPLVGDITLAFGEKSVDASGKEGPAHDGLDIKAPKGAKVFAPGDGVIVEATDRYRGQPAWGKVVVIDHGHGLETRYAHLDSYHVRKGDLVKAGDVIAAVGATGKVTGPHLHFETLQDGKPVDPEDTIALATPKDFGAAEPFELRAAEAAPGKPPRGNVGLPATQAGAPAAPALAAVPPAPNVHPAPKVSPAPRVEPHVLLKNDHGAFAFSGHPDAALFIAEDMEKRLLGALNGENVGSYNLSFRNGDKVYHFSSDQPMTAEMRAELREALKDMKRERERAMDEAGRLRDESREQTKRAYREAKRFAKDNGALAFNFNAENGKENAWGYELLDRAAIEAQREALEEAAADLHEAIGEDAFDNALADLDNAESSLDVANDLSGIDNLRLSSKELKDARAAISEARRQLERDREVHMRAFEDAQRGLEAERERLDLMLDEIDARDDGEE